MSLAFKDFANSSAMKLAMAVAVSFGTAANANAAPPSVGKCAPAEAVKASMVEAGYLPLVPFDKTFLNPDGSRSNRRYGFWANKNDLSEGYYVARHDDGNMCNEGKLSGIILADNRAKKIDPRVYSNGSEATNKKYGLNIVLNNAATLSSKYPMIQAQIIDVDGAKGVITIISNPTTRVGHYILSNTSGAVIDADSLDAGEVNGQKYGPQYTPVALSILDGKNRVADASNPTVAMAKLDPR